MPGSGPARRGTQFATGIVDLSPGRPARLLEVAPGRSSAAYGGWLAARDQSWREQVKVAALDPFRGYLTALRTHLPAATHVLDAFHVVKLGFTAVDDVRAVSSKNSSVTAATKATPLYEARRLLRRRADPARRQTHQQSEHRPGGGRPGREVTAAWLVAQDLALAYATTDMQVGRQRAIEVIDTARDCPVPEVNRLGRTLALWRTQMLAYFDTDRASNGPTEAINLLIENIRRFDHGYRNWRNYRLRLLLHCGVTGSRPITVGVLAVLSVRSRSPGSRVLAGCYCWSV